MNPELNNIFLDDIRMPVDAFNYTKDSDYLKEKWAIVRSYDEFVHYITELWKVTNKLPEMVSYDHDLADEHMDDLCSDENFNKKDEEIILDYDSYKEKTGMEAAKWLVNFCMDNNVKLPLYKVHSQNPVGKQNIISYLNNFKKSQSI